MSSKDLRYRAKCDRRILKAHKGVEIMIVLSEIMVELFVQGLKDLNPNITVEQIRRELRKVGEQYD
jgi:hypothetical protein